MTESGQGDRGGERARCRWCRAPLARRPGPGRRREYCRAACRQAAYRARALAAGHGLGADEVIVRTEELQALTDAVYVLQAALEDVEVDLADARTVGDLRAVLAHLVEAAEPVASLQVLAVTGRR